MNAHNKCDRCFKSTICTTMSMFNSDIICVGCKEKETQHPKYKEALDTENAMVRNGKINFKGIGKPSDL